ncbi:MAG: 16S rRNA (uracil(1498)-N(3))-methyltransferase [Rhizobiaceae bacterium]
MPRYDFTSHRMYITHHLKVGEQVELDRAQANYLLNVLRLKVGDHVLLFNGQDGEWRANISPEGRKKAVLVLTEQLRPQTPPYDLHYLFAPLKQARLEYMVQKAVEMGVGVLQPVLTEFTQLRKINHERMETHAIEAAAQCGILSLPQINKPLNLLDAIANMNGERQVIFCDEGDKGQNPLAALESLKPSPLALLIGPEGGFSEQEREALHALPNVTAIPLGPRVLRADTAAVAALAIIQAKLGDWQN